jgi:HAD superfamily hydrolase (TIGR01509 family)
MHPAPRLDWQLIDTVLLDMDGTLLDLRFDTEFWMEHLPSHYARRHEVDVNVARERLLAIMESVRPTLEYYCFDFWSDTTGLDVTALKPDLAHLIRYRPGAETFMAAVRASGRRSVIVTNSHPQGVALKHRITGIRDRVDAVESAHDHAHPKEHMRFWELVQERLAFDPARTLLVDDNLAVLDCAQRFGIGHLLAVRQPDSGRPPLADLPWPAVDAFDDLLPPEQS